MTNFAPQLTAYQKMRQKHHAQVNGYLDRLHQAIQEQLRILQECEEIFIEAEKDALKQFRALIEKDARCLLPTLELATHAKHVLAKRFSNQPDSPYFVRFDPDPKQWLLGKLADSVEILELSIDWEDDSDEEPPKTYWFHRLRVKVGHYQEKFYISIANEVQDNPATYRSMSLMAQYYEYCRKLKLNETGLKLNELQIPLVTQELSCLLVLVCNLLTVDNQVEHFCYPRPKWSW